MTFDTADATIATVMGSAPELTVMGVATGTTQVRAALNGTVFATVDLNVVSVQFSPSPLYIPAGSSGSVTVTVTPSSIASQLTFGTTDGMIAGVSGDSTGLTVTGGGAGTTQLQASLGGTVVGTDTVYSVEVTLTPNPVCTNVGAGTDLIADVNPLEAASVVTIAVADTTIATIGGTAPDMTVTGVAIGTTQVNATMNSTVLATTLVTISAASSSPTVQFTASTYTVGERCGTASISVTLNPPQTQTVTVNYATSDGTAFAPADYLYASGSLTFSPNVTQQQFNVVINQNDATPSVKTIGLTLSTPANAILGYLSTATLAINPTPDNRKDPKNVDLTIYHGQGGSELPDAKEDDAYGATTVANLNDTDGSGVMDKIDKTIVNQGKTTLTADVAKGATVLPVGSTDGYVAGTPVGIGLALGELGKVKAVNGNNITRCYAVAGFSTCAIAAGPVVLGL